MARLTTAARKRMPKSEFGLPEKGTGSGSYPMPDKEHASLAKAYAKRYASPSERKRIDAKANRMLGTKHRGLETESYIAGRSRRD